MATWLATQGVLGGSWTRLGSEAQWTSQMPCGRVAIGLKGASEAQLRLLGGKPGDAATSTGAGHDLAARHDGPSQMIPCGRVAIAASRGPASSEARLRVSGGKPVDAATSTHAHRHLLMTIDIDGPSVQGAAGRRLGS
jgi:hypothetical protein